MRDYIFLDRYLDELLEDVYPQPPDEIHSLLASYVIRKWMRVIQDEVNNVLDVGCGQGFCKRVFDEYGLKYSGITLGEDYKVCKENNLNVYDDDFSFLENHASGYYDLVFARHVLEHSPMPLLTLMEWYRVCKKYLILISPKPRYWGRVGKNHYSVLENDQLEFYLIRSGFEVIDRDHKHEMEYRFLCKKATRDNWEVEFRKFLQEHFRQQDILKKKEEAKEEALKKLKESNE